MFFSISTRRKKEECSLHLKGLSTTTGMLEKGRKMDEHLDQELDGTTQSSFLLLHRMLAHYLGPSDIEKGMYQSRVEE